MSIDQISKHVENQTKGENPENVKNKPARFSIGGLVASFITAILGIFGISTTSRDIDVIPAISIIIIAVIMAIRAFRPPMGAKKGIATWLGGFMISVCFIIIFGRAMFSHLDVGSFGAATIAAVIAFFLLRYGFKKHS
jgi:amino acid transporter